MCFLLHEATYLSTANLSTIIPPMCGHVTGQPFCTIEFFVADATFVTSFLHVVGGFSLKKKKTFQYKPHNTAVYLVRLFF